MHQTDRFQTLSQWSVVSTIPKTIKITYFLMWFKHQIVHTAQSITGFVHSTYWMFLKGSKAFFLSFPFCFVDNAYRVAYFKWTTFPRVTHSATHIQSHCLYRPVLSLTACLYPFSYLCSVLIVHLLDYRAFIILVTKKDKRQLQQMLFKMTAFLQWTQECIQE